ncbi:MAG: hypothetical protein AABX27_04610 [Nanoarchaeota archaeon]
MKDFFSFNSDAKIVITVREPEVEMSILRRLGKPKFWVSNNDFNIVMEKIYKTASKNAMAIFKSREE